MPTPKKSTLSRKDMDKIDAIDAKLEKSGVKITKKGKLRKASISVVRTKSTKALVLVHKAEAAIKKTLGTTLAASLKIDTLTKVQVGHVTKVVVGYIIAANAFNKTLKAGSKDDLGLTYKALRDHVKTLCGPRPEGGSINKIIRLGIEAALCLKHAPKTFKMNSDGEIIAKNNIIYKTSDVKGENTKATVKNKHTHQTVVPQKEITTMYKEFTPDIKKGADKKAEEKTKEKKEASELASRLASVEEMRVVDLVAALKGQKSNGSLSLEALSINQLKNVLAFLIAINPYLTIAQGKGHDKLTDYIRSIIKTHNEPTNVTTNEPKLIKGGAKKKAA